MFPIWCLMWCQVSIKVDYSSHAFIDNLRFYWLLNKFPREKIGRFCRNIWQLSCFLSDFNLRTVLQVVGHIFPFLPPFYDKHFCWKKKEFTDNHTHPPFPLYEKIRKAVFGYWKQNSISEVSAVAKEYIIHPRWCWGNMPKIQIQMSISTKYNGLNLCCGDQMSFHPSSHLGKPPKSKMLEVN